MFGKELEEKLKQHIEYFPKKEQAILLCLHEIQDHYGYVPPESLTFLSKLINVPLNHIEGVVAFYDMFDTEKPAKYRIRVCVSIVCHFMKNRELIDALKRKLGINFGEVTEDGKFKLIPVQCLGGCSEAPLFMINEDTYKYEGEDKLNEILSKYT